jgi:phage-related protein
LILKELELKIIYWHGNTLDTVRKFPRSVRVGIGSELYLLQIGEKPIDSKPMTIVGRGVWEIRVRDNKNAYRVLYLVKNNDGIHVLHAFQKKTQRISRPDVDLGKSRYRKLQGDN